MSTNLLDIKTEPSFLRALEEAAAHKLTAKELLEQKVSYVLSAVNEGTGITRDRIRGQLLASEGT